MKKFLTMSVLLVLVIVLTAVIAGNVSAQKERVSASADTTVAYAPEATAPSLGTATSFVVLGGSTVTNTGASVAIGDLGVSPGSAITGFPPGIVVGAVHAADAVAAQAQSDVTTAYNNLAGQACDVDLTGQDLGGLTLTTGTYCLSSSAQLTGTLTLDAAGDPDAVFIFQIGTTLTTATDSIVAFINGTTACNVFFQVGSSATLGTNTFFQGNILALTSITLITDASINGRALAQNGAVTLDTNNISNFQCSTATAAMVSVGGRVRSATGRGISGAAIRMTDGSGNVRRALTSPFGFYRFDDVEVGHTVILVVSHRRYRFPEPTRVISLNDEFRSADFTAY